MTEILNAHGSRNDIFVAGLAPRHWESEADLRAFVRALCARTGPFGGDGVYFYDARPQIPRAWFFNPDGSSSEFCGNGMRCLGRVLLEARGTDAVVVRSGSLEYTVRRAAPIAGVAQVTLEHPPVDFAREVVFGAAPWTRTRIPALDPALEFTAVSIPNPHLVAIVDKYVESDLIAMGERIAADPATFPIGANLSFVLPLTPDEIFVRTYERGAGLTAACGSGMAAARAVYSRLTQTPPQTPLLIRNAGGQAQVTLTPSPPAPTWSPVLTGNATYVYRTTLDVSAPFPTTPHLHPFPAETTAYATQESQNTTRLRSLGIETR